MEQPKTEVKQGMTGYPSIDRPWLKYYSEEAICSEIPECTMYEFISSNNKGYLDDVALMYFRKKITYKELFCAIDQTAAAFSVLGIRRGDVVTIQSLTVPQVIFSIYAINKIEAVANLIYANLDAVAVRASLTETNSRVLVIMEPLFRAIKKEIDDADMEAIIVMPIQEEMDWVTKAAYSIAIKVKKLVPEGHVFS